MLSVAAQNNIPPRYVIQGIGMLKGYVVYYAIMPLIPKML